jgi:hypothetical protein
MIKRREPSIFRWARHAEESRRAQHPTGSSWLGRSTAGPSHQRNCSEQLFDNRGCDVLQLAKTTVALAEKGLARRRRLDRASHDESRYLQPIQEYVARGITPAQELLKKFENEWNRSLAPVFKEYAY